MRYYAGQTIQDAIYVEDALGDPSLLDASLVFSEAHFTNPFLTNSQAVTVSPGSDPGVYIVSFDTDQTIPGLYTLYLVGSESGDVYLETYNVDPRQPIGGVTFADFRMTVAIDLRDGIIATAQSATDGTTFIDPNNFTDYSGAYESAFAVCASSVNIDNIGQTRIVASSSDVDGSVQFEVPFPAAFAVGDVLHLTNLGGLGFRPQVYDTAIQQCIRQAYPDALIPMVYDGAAVFDNDTPRINIPDDMVAIYAVSTLDDVNRYRGVPTSRPHSFDMWGNGYSVDVANRQVLIAGTYYRDQMDGKAFRLYGYTAHRAPTASNDIITLDEQYLIGAVKAKVAARRPNTREWDNWAVEWGRIAQQERMRIFTAREPNTIILR